MDLDVAMGGHRLVRRVRRQLGQLQNVVGLGGRLVNGLRLGLRLDMGGLGGSGSASACASAAGSSSEMIRRMEARISSMVGSGAFESDIFAAVGEG